MGYSDRRPAPLASAAPGLLHSAIRCGPTPTLPVGPLLRGTDRGGALGGGGEGPDLAAEAPAEAALEATTPKAETTAEATTRRAEATAEAAAHKAKEPAEASAQTETEAPAARAKAPADAATRKPWWNLFRICNISAVAVATVEQGIASVKCAASSRTAGALLAGARDACAALDYDWTRPIAASAVAERSASASAASAIAVGRTVEQGIASVKCAASSRTAGALLAGARDACAALDYDRTRPIAASAVAEQSASASAASAIAVGCTASSKASPPSSAMTRLARPALSWPARETPAPPSCRCLRRSRAIGQRLCRPRHRRRLYRRARHRLRQAR